MRWDKARFSKNQVTSLLSLLNNKGYIVSRSFKAQSNVQVHGYKWAFAHALLKYEKQGWAHNTAWTLAANEVFGRYVQ